MVQRDNSVYWIDKEARAQKAALHTEEMAEKYADQIKDSIKNTITYDKTIKGDKTEIGKPSIFIFPEDSVSGIFNYHQGKTCVLNFASFKEAGGLFLKGSKAQEECLCHESFLYNVLKEHDQYYKFNQTNLNRGLYRNRALYSPNIYFTRDGQTVKADVLTCAAPNFYTANKYCNISAQENSKILRSRIKFVLSALKAQGVETAILGAFGCGVFAQDATEVAQIFKEEIENIMGGSKFNAVFAVPEGRDGNYQKMKDVFEGNVRRERYQDLDRNIAKWEPPKSNSLKTISDELERD